MRRRSPVRMATIGLGLALTAAMLAPVGNVGRGQEAGVHTIYYKSRAFRIPVTIPPEGREVVREVRLWVSDDRGYAWKEFGQTAPDRPEFPFRATRDGEYWFALQTVDLKGRIYPSDDRPVDPSLKVVVDTTAPTIALNPVGRRGSLAAVSWEAQDDYLVTGTFALEYQVRGAGENDWRTVPLRRSDLELVGSRADFRLVGRKNWDAGTSDPIRVRASVKDKAGNVRVAEVDLESGLSSQPGAAAFDGREFDAPPPTVPISARSRPMSDPASAVEDPFEAFNTRASEAFPPAPAAPPETQSQPTTRVPKPAGSDRTLLAGSPRFPLQYAIDNAGPAGVGKVQLWVTHDGGRTWYPQPEDEDRESPYLADVGGEGTFGLWLAVQGLSGLGDAPPAPGDRPQMRVEVDSTPPVVQLDPPRAGTGQYAGRVRITWRASDPHLGPRPVMLFYRAEGADGAWNPITPTPIANEGLFIWDVPPGTPPRFRIRVEVEDTLGHKEAAESGSVLVDRARPTGRIIGLDPGPQTGGIDRR